jgi:hypothetical protein
MILRRLIVLVVVNRLVRVDALLVVGKEVFEYWNYLSNSPKAAGFAAPFEALCSSLERF